MYFAPMLRAIGWEAVPGRRPPIPSASLFPFVGMRIRHEARVRLQNRRLLRKTGTFARLWRDPNLGAQPLT